MKTPELFEVVVSSSIPMDDIWEWMSDIPELILPGKSDIWDYRFYYSSSILANRSEWGFTYHSYGHLGIDSSRRTFLFKSSDWALAFKLRWSGE